MAGLLIARAGLAPAFALNAAGFAVVMVGAISQRWGVSTAFLLGGVCGLGALAALGGWWRGRGPR